MARATDRPLPGRPADLVVIAGNPVKDADEFRRVISVMKGGVVCRQGARPTAQR